MNQADFDEMCRLICPHCRAGHAPVQRMSTKEWVHNTAADIPRGRTISTTICWATGVRGSRFDPGRE